MQEGVSVIGLRASAVLPSTGFDVDGRNVSSLFNVRDFLQFAGVALEYGDVLCWSPVG